MISVGLAARKTGLVGRIFGSLFFSIFAGFGLVFCVLLGREVYTVGQTYTWTKTACVILDSKVVEESQGRESPYQFRVKYQYNWQGKNYTSEQFAQKTPSFSDYTKAQRLAEKFKADTRNTCFVNPANPAEALLQRQSFWLALFMFIPLLFVVIGLGGIYAMWRVPEVTDPDANPGPITEKARIGRFAGCFFLLFFLAGAAVAYLMGVQPLYRILVAQSWQPVPCTVEASRVQNHSSDDGTTYSVDILYAYEFNGQEYKSSRYDFVTGSSSGYKGKAEIVGRYPPGSKTTCYVNPKHPIEAVLNRGWRWPILWFGILFPIPFLAVGIGGAYFAMRKKRSQQTTRAGTFYGTPIIYEPSNPNNKSLLRPKSQGSRVGIFLGSILIAAFWNGIVSIFLNQVWQNWRHHHLEWGLALFMIPFVAVGLFLLGMVVYYFLALFNPRVRLTVSPASPCLGDLLDVQWQIQGNTASLKRLRIYLEGREEVWSTENKGMNPKRPSRRSTANALNLFANFDLANIDHAQMMASGEAQIKIPLDTAPSFSGGHNKIIWVIRVEGEIPHWPDIKDEFPLTVRPLPLEQISIP